MQDIARYERFRTAIIKVGGKPPVTVFFPGSYVTEGPGSDTGEWYGLRFYGRGNSPGNKQTKPFPKKGLTTLTFLYVPRLYAEAMIAIIIIIIIITALCRFSLESCGAQPPDDSWIMTQSRMPR